ncbi:MAG: CinA family protein [Deltaproteobacteria bacterium]|jgi:PncC family amidohydrolase|nr:CinA family protein [Deltaproteobacteria bacterium]
MFFERNLELLTRLGEALLRRKWLLCAAESCTGGLVAAACTHLPGSSAWFSGGVVCYANAVKTRLLRVPEEEIALRGAVSPEVARSMAVGAAELCGADCVVAVSGIAGPAGGTPDKPVGTVCLAWGIPAAAAEKTPAGSFSGGFLKKGKLCLAGSTARLPGQRREVREEAARLALKTLLAFLE